MLASDAANPQFSGAHNPDSLLHVTFYNKAVKNNFESEKAGRPIFDDVVYIRIHTPGNQLNVIDRPMYATDKARFPIQWARFHNESGEGQGQHGTPLSQWPAITAAQAETLRGMKFTTVESVANASDAQIMGLGSTGSAGSPYALREKARAFLAVASDTALPQRLAAENQALKEQMEERERQHTAQMIELRKMIEDLAANQKGKPGRKPKEPEAA